MSFYIRNWATSTDSELVKMKLLPQHRRSTVNGMASLIVAQKLLAEIPQPVDSERVGLVVCSNFGELQTTKAFLRALYRENLPRPLLFQSSLHNATAGFVAIQSQIKGPSVSMSSGPEALSAGLATAEMILQMGDADFVLLLEVDDRLSELMERAMLDGNNAEIAAGCMLAREGQIEVTSWKREQPEKLDAVYEMRDLQKLLLSISAQKSGVFHSGPTAIEVRWTSL